MQYFENLPKWATYPNGILGSAIAWSSVSLPFPEATCFHNYKQECIPVEYVPFSAVAVRGVVSTRHPPGSRHTPQTRHTPADQAHPRRPGTPQTRHPPGSRHPPPCGQTHACKHITFPQTSFAGGKNAFQ